ncbi:MAG: transcriptional regulator GcvA, partial [bacterium]
MNTLPAFEAAARHLSFSRAAEELHVTQAAVSQQIKQLEQKLGVKLFERIHRGLRLTPEGLTFQNTVSPALDDLRRVTANVREPEGDGVLTLSVLPSFAAKWLVSRLWKFQDEYPEIDVRIDASTRLANFVDDDIDIAIRHGPGGWSGLESIFLLDEDFFPVCTPDLIEQSPLDTPSDLLQHQLLWDTEYPSAWEDWFNAAGVKQQKKKGTGYNNAALMIQAAIEGQGVAMARRLLAEDDLESGRLVKPFTLSLPSDFAYYIVYPPRASGQFKVQAFRDWILSESPVSMRNSVTKTVTTKSHCG